MSVSLTKSAPANTGNNISSMKRSRDFRIKYINILLSSWEVPSLFSCFFVYEHAHLTADYRGRDLASLPYGEGKLTRISFTVSLQRKDR